MHQRILTALSFSLCAFCYGETPNPNNLEILQHMAAQINTEVEMQPEIALPEVSNPVSVDIENITTPAVNAAPQMAIKDAIPKTPKMIAFKNNQTLQIDLSVDDPNRLFIHGDKITNVSCPEGFCLIDRAHLVETGDLLLTLSHHARQAGIFTFFISSESGAELTLLAQGKHTIGQTIGFKGSGQVKALNFEKEAPYAELVIRIMKAMIQTHQTGDHRYLPNGFTMAVVADTDPGTTTDKGFTLTPVAILQGGVFSGRVTAIKNNNPSDLTLAHKSFYQPSMVAVSFSKEIVKPGAVGFVYTVMQADENDESNN